jgi:outer membrane protein assembly factor BamB
MKHSTLTLIGLLAFCLAIPAAFAAESPAAKPAGPLLGASDFLPTPEMPVGFRPNNAWYPGAGRPPLEFWDGTPGEVEIDGKRGKQKVWDCTDTKAKNILWKAPAPGWGLTHPIVVGKRVFAVGNPDVVACYDLDSGKVLWKKRISPAFLDGLPEAQAKGVQVAVDLALALTKGARCINPNAAYTFAAIYGDLPYTKKGDLTAKAEEIPAIADERRKRAGQYVRMLTKHRPAISAAGDADLLKALDDDLSDISTIEKASETGLEYLTLIRTWSSKRKDALVKILINKYKIPLVIIWGGYVGLADSTLASDGERIYGVFDQGQVFCLDLDGKMLWGSRDQVIRDNRGTFHRSPNLCQGLLLVSGYDKSNGLNTMRAFDAKTGKLRWESPFLGSNYTIPRVVRLTRPTGEVVPVLVGNGSHPYCKPVINSILRITDGAKVGEFPLLRTGRGLLLGVVDDVIMFSSADDGGGGDNAAYRLKWTGPDSVTMQQLFLTTKEDKNRPWGNQHEFPTVFGKYWLYSREGNDVTDAFTGDKVGRFDGKMSFSAVAGTTLIGINNHTGDFRNQRDDRKAVATIVLVDISDPAKPKILSDRNVLAYADPPADLLVSEYLSEFDPLMFAYGYGGTAGYFSHMGGPVPVGNRLLIQSSAFLYCIGEK